MPVRCCRPLSTFTRGGKDGNATVSGDSELVMGNFRAINFHGFGPAGIINILVGAAGHFTIGAVRRVPVSEILSERSDFSSRSIFDCFVRVAARIYKRAAATPAPFHFAPLIKQYTLYATKFTIAIPIEAP